MLRNNLIPFGILYSDGVNRWCSNCDESDGLVTELDVDGGDLGGAVKHGDGVCAVWGAERNLREWCVLDINTRV